MRFLDRLKEIMRLDSEEEAMCKQSKYDQVKGVRRIENEAPNSMEYFVCKRTGEPITDLHGNYVYVKKEDNMTQEWSGNGWTKFNDKLPEYKDGFIWICSANGSCIKLVDASNGSHWIKNDQWWIRAKDLVPPNPPEKKTYYHTNGTYSVYENKGRLMLSSCYHGPSEIKVCPFTGFKL